MRTNQGRWNSAAMLGLVTLTALAACGDDDEAKPADQALPQLSAAQPAARQICDTLATGFTFADTSITAASVVAAAAPDPDYCQVTGKMKQRTSPVDGKDYAIQFEMRLPANWNGRFFHQGNGGVDGAVAAATGAVGSPSVNALQHGFAVLSSDAGHPTRSADFGLDPQARLDYGYQAVGTLTPMAKALITSAYGKGPDRSYFGGSSNGGRHAMVAAARYANDYDGILAHSPGFNLPKAAVAQLWGAQQWATVATDVSVPTAPDNGLNTAFTAAERNLVAGKILDQCDALDGLADGMVNDAQGCQSAFDLVRDVPACAGARDGSCLSTEQLDVVSRVFAGATTSTNATIYSSWLYDPGIRQQGWADWKFQFSVNNQRDAVAYGYIFATPPNPPGADTLAYALALDIDEAARAIEATDATYTESSMSFMTPPNPTNLDSLRGRGAKMIVVHGAADGVFSPKDTANWYDALNAANGGKADEFARVFMVPGMGHSRGGPATDQYDALQSLVDWVEQHQAPDSIVANVRADNADAIGQGWPTNRTRPLCPYPLKAMYVSGDPESAASFACR